MMTASMRAAYAELPRRSFVIWLRNAKTHGLLGADIVEDLLDNLCGEEPPHLRGMLSVVPSEYKKDARALWNRWRAWQRRNPVVVPIKKKKTKQA